MKNPTHLILVALAFGTALTASLPAAEPVGQALKTGTEPRVDNWVDTWMLAQRGPAGQVLDGGYSSNNGHQILDTTDAKCGLFAVRFTVGTPRGKSKGDSAWGFSSGPYLKHWALGKDFTLQGWIKASADSSPNDWRVVVRDTAGRKAESALEGIAADGKWREIKLPLASLKAESGFDFGAVRSMQVEAALPVGGQIWLDDVRFESGEEILGVSDKTITQYMAETAATRALRVDKAMSEPTRGTTVAPIAEFYTGENLEEANRKLIEWLDKQGDGPGWSLIPNTGVNTLYYGFSSKGRIKPNRLSAEAERRLLEFCWKHNEIKNDIATARQSPWWVTSSENHDINFKMANLLSSQILMHQPEYAKRIYPDLGRMQGYGFIEGTDFFVEKASSGKIILGSGNYKDGKEYNAADHYKEWVVFWKNYLAERARYGFFIEHNAEYMPHTMGFLHHIYAWSEDEDLRRQAHMFLDLVWAHWAQDQILGISAGPSTRGGPGYSMMSHISQFYLGGSGSSAAISDYAWPREVWEMALGRAAMGEYAFASRKTMEAADVWPAPPGLETTMNVRPDSRIVRYCWVTPDYVMGTRMDHPDALYIHTSETAEAVNFASNTSVRWGVGSLAVFRSVQDRSVMLVRPKGNKRVQNPAWFSGDNGAGGPASPMQVAFEGALDRIEEKEGWVFVQEGNAYVAVRLVSAWSDPAKAAQRVEDLKARDDLRVTDKKIRAASKPTAEDFDADGFGLMVADPMPYTWLEAEGSSKKIGRTLVAKITQSALIIEASRKPHHATLEDFQKDVLDNPFKLKQVINGFRLTYQGCGKDAKELYLNCANGETPKIGGAFVRYDSPTFDSPWLKGAAGSGVVTLTGPISGQKMTFDFNKITRTQGESTPLKPTTK